MDASNPNSNPNSKSSGVRKPRWHTATRWDLNPAVRFEQAETDIEFVRTMAIIYRDEFPRVLGRVYIEARTVLQQRDREPGSN